MEYDWRTLKQDFWKNFPDASQWQFLENRSISWDSDFPVPVYKILQQGFWENFPDFLNAQKTQDRVVL